jgi:[CysO sulfur-carrier protein]-S-L-cysteine hydrolase
MFVLDTEQYDALVRHARSEYPNEACALLAGDGRVEKVYALPNAEASPTFYVVEPKAQLAAMQEMDDEGWDLVGIFHSHTFTEAYPSKTDVELAAYPDATYLILTLMDPEAPRLRAFSIKEGEVSELDVVIGNGDGRA